MRLTIGLRCKPGDPLRQSSLHFTQSLVTMLCRVFEFVLETRRQSVLLLLQPRSGFVQSLVTNLCREFELALKSHSDLPQG